MSLGIGELFLILIVVLILFGAGKLPQVMKDLGKGVKSFKDGVNEAQSSTTNSATQVEEKKEA